MRSSSSCNLLVQLANISASVDDRVIGSVILSFTLFSLTLLVLEQRYSSVVLGFEILCLTIKKRKKRTRGPDSEHYLKKRNLLKYAFKIIPNQCYEC